MFTNKLVNRLHYNMPIKYTNLTSQSTDLGLDSQIFYQRSRLVQQC